MQQVLAAVPSAAESASRFSGAVTFLVTVYTVITTISTHVKPIHDSIRPVFSAGKAIFSAARAGCAFPAVLSSRALLCIMVDISLVNDHICHISRSLFLQFNFTLGQMGDFGLFCKYFSNPPLRLRRYLVQF